MIYRLLIGSARNPINSEVTGSKVKVTVCYNNKHIPDDNLEFTYKSPQILLIYPLWGRLRSLSICWLWGHGHRRSLPEIAFKMIGREFAYNFPTSHVSPLGAPRVPFDLEVTRSKVKVTGLSRNSHSR